MKPWVVVLTAIGFWLLGGILVAVFGTLGAYIMVVLDLLGLGVLLVGLPLALRRRRVLSHGG